MDGEGDELGLLDGTGTGDEGGGEGGEGEESFIEEESGGGEGGGGEGGEGGAESGEGGGEGGEGAQRAIVKFTPDLVKKALREISAKDPDFAKKFPTLEKAVTTALYKDSRIRALGGLQAVNQLAETVQAHGGIEGIEAQAEELRLFREMEGGMKKGDPLIIDGWLKDYPSGLKRLLLPAIEKIAKIDDAFVDQVICNQADKILARCGVYGALTKLGESLTADKKEDAVKSYNDLVKFFGELKNLAARAGSSAGGERDAELDAERDSLEEEKKKMFYGSVRQDVNTQVMARMNRLIKLGLPAGKKITVERANRLRKEINAELQRVVVNAPGYAEKYESVMAARDKARAVQFIVSNALAKDKLPRVVTQILREFDLKGTGSGGGSNNGAQRRVVRNQGGGGGSTMQSGKPKHEDIDWTRTDKAVWLSSVSAGKSVGPIFLKNGKRAQW